MKSGFERVGHDIAAYNAQRMCFDKKCYPSRNKARDAAARRSKLTDGQVYSSYHCRICHDYHLTSIPKQFFDAARTRLSRRP